MTIDIRASVTCSLGLPLISASLSDDYVQGTGLIKCKGSCELSGIATPTIGTVVTFSYTRDGVTTQVPRKLRVLSSFADPFRRTTSLSLGCKLTYLEDLKEPVEWTALDDPANASYTSTDAQIITLPISASSVMAECLTQLGITASSNPLTNLFSTDKFDFGPGYVAVVSDLLLSECYCGYLDINEVLQVISLNQSGGDGPAVDSSKLIDIAPINVGSLPGEAVVVNYSTLKLRQPDNTDNAETIATRNWERSEAVVGPNYYYIGNRTFSGNEETVTATSYNRINGKDVPVLRVTTESGCTAKIAGSLGSAYESVGISFNAIETVLRKTVETSEYDLTGNLVKTIATVYDQLLAVFGGLSLQYVRSVSDYVSFDYNLIARERTVTEYWRSGSTEQQVVRTYKLWPLTIFGNQAIAENRSALSTSAAVVDFLNAVVESGLVYENTFVQLNSVGETIGRPSGYLNASYADGGDSTNGWRTESSASLEFDLGSATAQRRIELSLPYAPDDTFYKTGYSYYYAKSSDAAEKARYYGRIQNRLLLGNRSGMNVQMAASVMPATPFAPIVIQANGLSALYRTNGTSWQMDASGILASTDALFWGAVGGTGEFWFPVAPGISALPTTPPVVDGQITVSTVVPVWNETVVLAARTRSTLSVTSLPYSLTLLTPVAVKTRTRMRVSRPINCATGSFTLAGENVGLQKSLVITSAPTEFLLTAAAAALTIYPYRLTCETGSYTLSGKEAYRSVRIATGTAAPLLGTGAATSYTGWTRIQNANVDDGSIGFLNWAFSVTLANTTYNGVYAGSNTYLTFGEGSSLYAGLSASTPPLPKILFGAGDHSYQRIYTFTGQAADNSAIAKLRYEGSSSTTGTPGSPTIVAEFTFYAPRANGDQWIELRVGSHNATTAPFMIASASTAYATATMAADTSWVFVGNSTGTSWTLTSNRYVD